MKARTSCIYSDSGEGKSTQCYFMVKWVYKTFGKRTRWISFDGKYDQITLGQPDLGGKSLIEAGMVELFDATKAKSALADPRMLIDGYWPIKAKVKATGQEVNYLGSIDKCETKDWDNIGLYVIDDLTSLCDNWLAHISDQDVVGFKPSWIYTEEQYTFRGLQDAHYGIVQKELIRIIKQGFNTLPVNYVMYTAKVEKGTENYRRRKVRRNDPDAPPEPNITTMYGPKVAGQALTSFLPGWFADCFHIGRVPIDPAKYKEAFGVDGEEVRVAYYDRHEHRDTGIPFICRADLLPEQVPKLREKFKGGRITLGFTRGIDKFYEFIRELEGKA